MNSELLLDNQISELDERKLWCNDMANRKGLIARQSLLVRQSVRSHCRTRLKTLMRCWRRFGVLPLKRTLVIALVILVLLSSAILALRWASSETPCENFPDGDDVVLSDEQRLRLQLAFAPRVSPDERHVIGETLRILSSQLSSAGVTYFLYGGTLLGSLRHHGLIPWDDDVDVFVNYSQIAEAELALRSVDGYELYTGFRWRYKLYPKNGNRINGKQWRWPYVDICFFEENKTHIIDVEPLSRDYVYNKSDVFPLVMRPYEGQMLPAPRDTRQVVGKHVRNEAVCVSNSWSHRNEDDVPRKLICTVKCRHLFGVYPFVFRVGSSKSTGEVEILRVGNTTLSHFSAADSLS